MFKIMSLIYGPFRAEATHSEARFGILVKNQPGGQILSQIGANWTHFVAIFQLRQRHDSRLQWGIELVGGIGGGICRCVLGFSDQIPLVGHGAA